MYCTKCGRFTEDFTCPKCYLPIDEETRIIAEKYRPTTTVCLIAYIFAIPFLIIELFIKRKSPRDRAAIECAKSSLFYFAIVAGLYLLSLNLSGSAETIGKICGFFARGFGFLTWLYIIMTIVQEKKKAMGIQKKKKHQKEAVSYPQNP